MAIDAGTAELDVDANLDRAAKSLDRDVPGMFGKFGATAGKVFGAAAALGVGGLVGSAVTDVFSGSVEAATNLGESVNAVNKIFGDSAKEILDWGNSSANSFGLSRSEFNKLATPLGALLKNSGLDNISDQTITLTKRAADLASVFNVDVSTAMQAINSGLKGEADPLEQFGIGLSAAKVDAQALSDTGKKLTKDLTDQEKAQARINLIMKESESVAGDFISTSGEYANAQRISAARTEELRVKIGEKLIPIMERLTVIKLQIATFIVDYVIPAFEKVGTVIGWLGDHTNVLIGIGVGLVAGLAAWAISSLIAAVASGTLATSMIGVAVATIAATLPFIAIGLAVAALVAGVIWAYQNWDWFREAVDKVADGLQWFYNEVLKPIGEWIINSLVPWIRDELVPAIGRFGEKIADMATTLAGWVVTVWNAGGQVLDWFRELDAKIRDALGAVADAIMAPFKAAFEWIQDKYDKTIGPIIDKLGSVSDALPGGGGGLLDGGLVGRFFRAGGGPVTAGHPYIVGEERPELFVPNVSGVILPRVPESPEVREYHYHLSVSTRETEAPVTEQFRRMEMLAGMGAGI